MNCYPCRVSARASSWLLLCLLWFPGCTSTRARSITEISIERTGCTDPCPAYRAVLRRDGTVEYHGNDQAPLPGYWIGRLTSVDFDELSRVIVQHGFLDMAPQYGDVGLHFGPVVTSIVTNRGVKRVKNYGFYGPSGPLQLQWIEAAIDVVIENRVERWERGNSAGRRTPKS